MSINAANARAIALDVAIAGTSTNLSFPGEADNSADTSFSAIIGPVHWLRFSGLRFPHRAETGRPLRQRHISGVTLTTDDTAAYHQWAEEDLAAMWRKVRHRLSGLQNDNQAAALLLFACKVSPEAVLQFLLPYYEPYLTNDLPAVPHTGNEPLLATMMRQFSAQDYTPASIWVTDADHRIQEALLFFGRTVPTIDAMGNGTYTYNLAKWA